jgi:hypothetical protein
MNDFLNGALARNVPELDTATRENILCTLQLGKFGPFENSHPQMATFGSTFRAVPGMADAEAHSFVD